MNSKIFCCVALLAVWGCGKKEATVDAPSEAPARPAKRVAADKSDDGAYDPNAAPVASNPNASSKSADGGGQSNWDAMVAEIIQIRRGAMTDDSRVRMLSLQDQLSDAAKTDPTAREAYQNLSRLINGR